MPTASKALALSAVDRAPVEPSVLTSRPANAASGVAERAPDVVSAEVSAVLPAVSSGCGPVVSLQELTLTATSASTRAARTERDVMIPRLESDAGCRHATDRAGGRGAGSRERHGGVYVAGPRLPLGVGQGQVAGER